MAKYDEKGREIPDPTPIEIPVGFKRPLTLQEEIQRAIRGEMSRQAQQLGLESFEEANDFDVMDEEDMPQSRHEILEEDEYQRREMELLDRAEKEMGRSRQRDKGDREDGERNESREDRGRDRRGRDDRNGARSVDRDAREEGGEGNSPGGRGVDKAGDDAA